MKKDTRFLICGAHKVLNGAFTRTLSKKGFLNIAEPSDISVGFKAGDIVIFTGALSGGIAININHPADLMYKNLIAQTNIIKLAKDAGVKKLVFIASSCVYPKDCPQPIKEESLLKGALEQTSEPYAVAKIAGIKMCQAYNNQYKTNFISIVPATIYGPDDDFDPRTCHVLQALLGRFHEAKKEGKKNVRIWGSGRPRREFIFADDLADAALFLLDNYSQNMHINVGCSKDCSINELVDIISKEIGFKGRIINDITRPDGACQKLLDSGKINSLGWKPKINLIEGINITYKWYDKRRDY